MQDRDEAGSPRSVAAAGLLDPIHLVHRVEKYSLQLPPPCLTCAQTAYKAKGPQSAFPNYEIFELRERPDSVAGR